MPASLIDLRARFGAPAIASSSRIGRVERRLCLLCGPTGWATMLARPSLHLRDALRAREQLAGQTMSRGAHTSTVLGGALGYSLMPVLNRYPRLVQKLKVRGDASELVLIVQPLSEKYLNACGYRCAQLRLDEADGAQTARPEVRRPHVRSRRRDLADVRSQEENDVVQKVARRVPRRPLTRAGPAPPHPSPAIRPRVPDQGCAPVLAAAP